MTHCRKREMPGIVSPGGGLAAVLALTLGLGVAPAAAEGCADAPGLLVVQVVGVRSSKGSVVAVLYGDKEDDFLKKGRRLAREGVPAAEGAVTVCLHVPRAGTYALAVYHDENDNRRLDRSWAQLPAEGFGLSNNPKPILRMPTHAESAFEAGGGRKTVLTIELRY